MQLEIFNVGVLHALILSAIVFGIGACGVIMNRRSVVSVLLSIELMLLGVNINFVAFGTELKDISGQIFTILVLTVAAAEAAIGLALLVVYYRNKGNVEIQEMKGMQG